MGRSRMIASSPFPPLDGETDNPQSLLSTNPKQYLRFAPLVLGLIITLAATGMQTWKESAMASGISLSAFVFLVVGVLGENYEHTGALIGLEFLVAQLV